MLGYYNVVNLLSSRVFAERCLARLPLKSLLQIRAVSKSWCALIDSQEFIKLHLNRLIMDGRSQKIIWSESVRFSHRIINSHSLENFRRTAVKVRYPFWRFQVGFSYVVGSCNGQLFVKNSKLGMFLWNLSTQKCWKFPRTPHCSKFSERRALEIRYGFGYDDTSDDYKVVKLVGVKHKGSRPKCHEAEIYSLKSHSWKQLPDFPFGICDIYKNRNSGVLANCALHWMVEAKEYRKKGKLIYPTCIAAIDLRTEEYRFLQLPEFSKDLPWSFEALDGCLSMVCCNSNDPDNPSMVQMWVTKDYGKEDSWSKLTLKYQQTIHIRP